MTPTERINLQKKKEIPNRLQASSNSEDKAIDNYIMSHLQLKENQKQDNEEQIPKKLIEDIKKQIIKEIENTFKK